VIVGLLSSDAEGVGNGYSVVQAFLPPPLLSIVAGLYL
jgi:hypothetical protein